MNQKIYNIVILLKELSKPTKKYAYGRIKRAEIFYAT